jgi:hypothetical protein
MAPPGIFRPWDHIEPFRLPYKRAVGNFHPQVMVGVWGKMKAIGKSGYRMRPLVFRTLIRFGGRVKIAVFNIRPQNDRCRFGIHQPFRQLIGRMAKKTQDH